MGEKVNQFSTSTRDDGQQAITHYKDSDDGKTRRMRAKKIVSLAAILLAGVAFLFLSIEQGPSPS